MAPITEEEVRIIEAYLGKALNELLGPALAGTFSAWARRDE